MKRCILLLGIALCFTSCATVKFYNDSELTEESGIEFFSPKPYLLIEKKPAKDVALQSTIIYLPDYENPKYAKLKPGIGSNDLQLSLSNGIITSYGVSSDSKIPETITALTGVLSSTGTTYKSFAEALDIIKKENEEALEDKSGNKSSMIKAGLILDGVVLDLNQLKSSDLLTEYQKQEVENVQDSLKNLGAEIKKGNIEQIPAFSKELEKISKQLSTIKITSDSDEAQKLKSKLENNIKEISIAKELIFPSKKPEESSFELYEIVIGNGKTELKRVEFPE